MVELKVPGIARQVGEEIAGERMLDDVIITGTRDVLIEARQECPHFTTYLAGSWGDSLCQANLLVGEHLDWVVANGIRIMGISIYTLSDPILEMCRCRGVTVWGSRALAPTDGEISDFLSLGLDGLLTDVPAQVVKVMRKPGQI